MLDILQTQSYMAEGIALLDDRTPNWVSLVNWEALDIRDENCVLGQLFGSYSEGKYELHIVHRGGYEFGFDVPSGTGTDENYAHLTEMWREFAAERLSE